MAIMLTSILQTHYYDAKGKKHAMAIPDTNGALTTIKKYVKKCDKVVYVVNDPDLPRKHVRSKRVVFKGLKMTGLRFKKRVVLYRKNAADANAILSDADLIILGGGKILCQKKFFDDIGLKDILKDYTGLVIGVSAGTMNLCEKIANFPEELADLGQQMWVDGMGFYDRMVIPHFDGKTRSYQLPCNEIDVVNDYILPMSEGKEFLGMPNDSFILIDGADVSMHGEMYIISDGKVAEYTRS